MPSPSSVLRVTVVTIAVVVTAVVGYFVGFAIADYRDTRAELVRDAASQATLDASVRGITEGAPLPETLVWSMDGVTATPLQELLPGGGLIVYLSGTCGICQTTVAAAWEVRLRLGVDCPDIIVVLADDPEEFVGFMREHDIQIPVYRDVEENFRSVYHVNVYPTAIKIDAYGIVRVLKTAVNSEQEFTALLTG